MDLPGTGSSHGPAHHQIEKKTINIAPQINRANFIKCNNLEVLYTNADSLSNKINELKLLIRSFDKKTGIISITEVKHKNKWNTTVSELTSPGYILYTNDLNSTSRGIAMYVDRELKSKQLYSRINALENVIIEIELNNTRLVVTTIYRSPNSADDKLLV